MYPLCANGHSLIPHPHPFYTPTVDMPNTLTPVYKLHPLSPSSLPLPHSTSGDKLLIAVSAPVGSVLGLAILILLVVLAYYCCCAKRKMSDEPYVYSPLARDEDEEGRYPPGDDGETGAYKPVLSGPPEEDEKEEQPDV
jgi:hypothetical protein